MERIVVAGPFNEIMRAALVNAIPNEAFSMEFIDTYEQFDKLNDADYIILRTLSIDRDRIKKLHKAKLIQRWGAGFDTVDIAAAGENGIQVAVTAGMNAVPVSEMALALALAVYRNLVPLTNSVMDGRWERDQFGKRSFTISGKCVGILGMGNIGKRVAALYNAFGAEVIYFDSYRLTPEQEKEQNVFYTELEELWKRSDIISLHAPLTNDTQDIVNKAAFDLMKPGTVLINTARYELVDIQAATDALKSGKLLGAAFDAIEQEFPADNPFSGMDNVVLTPHLGGNTTDNTAHMAKRCAEQIIQVSQGARLTPPHLVNGRYLN